MPGWSDAPEDPVGQIDEEDPRSGNGLGSEAWSQVPGARCWPGGRWGVGKYWDRFKSWTTTAYVSVNVRVTVTALGCFPSFGGADCAGQVQLAIRRRMLEDRIGLSIQP